MKKKPRDRAVADDEMLPEYDFSGGVRGRYAKRFAEEGCNIVVVSPDLMKDFPNSASVNRALRKYRKVARLMSDTK